MENEDIFMQINNLNMSDKVEASVPKEAAATATASVDMTIITNVGLPSARTLRGGASIVARGRHEVPKSAMSNYSNYSSSSSCMSSSR